MEKKEAKTTEKKDVKARTKAKPKASRNGGPSRRGVVLSLFQKGTSVDAVIAALGKAFQEEEKSARRRTLRIMRKAISAGYKMTETSGVITLIKAGGGHSGKRAKSKA